MVGRCREARESGRRAGKRISWGKRSLEVSKAAHATAARGWGGRHCLSRISTPQISPELTVEPEMGPDYRRGLGYSALSSKRKWRREIVQLVQPRDSKPFLAAPAVTALFLSSSEQAVST